MTRTPPNLRQKLCAAYLRILALGNRSMGMPSGEPSHEEHHAGAYALRQFPMPIHP